MSPQPQISQREAVTKAVLAIFAAHKIKYELGNDARPLMTTEMRHEVIEHCVQQFTAGTARLSKDFEGKTLKSYCNGLVSNWLRKDKQLNGGTKYEIQNPGARAGQGSPEIRELRKLLNQVKGTPNEAKVQKILDSKVESYKSSKAKKVEIDMSVLDPEMAKLAASIKG